MTCEEALLLISGHLDQENTPEEELQLQTHLQQCEACLGLLRSFEEIDAGVMTLEEEAPADLCDKVMYAIKQETPAKQKKRHVWRSLAVAAVLVTVVGFGAMKLPQFRTETSADAMLFTARSADAPALATADYAAEETMIAAYQTDSVTEDDGSSISPQELANSRGADIAVTTELFPEMEVCPCEALEDGSLLYCLDSADGAVVLSRTYGTALYEPETAGTSDVSYALLVP